MSLGRAGSEAVESLGEAVVWAEHNLKKLTISGWQGPRQLAISGSTRQFLESEQRRRKGPSRGARRRMEDRLSTTKGAVVCVCDL